MHAGAVLWLRVLSLGGTAAQAWMAPPEFLKSCGAFLLRDALREITTRFPLQVVSAGLPRHRPGRPCAGRLCCLA